MAAAAALRVGPCRSIDLYSRSTANPLAANKTLGNDE